MTSVWFAASGSGEDGDPWDVREVFATKELAEAYCNRPDKPKWEHAYVQEWEVTGSFLTDEDRKGLEKACDLIDNKTCGDSTTLRKLLDRLA